MCLMRGSAVATPPCALTGRTRTPIAVAAALPATIDSHARRPKGPRARPPSSAGEPRAGRSARGRQVRPPWLALQYDVNSTIAAAFSSAWLLVGRELRHDLHRERAELLEHHCLGRAHADADVDVLEAGVTGLDVFQVRGQLLGWAGEPGAVLHVV